MNQKPNNRIYLRLGINLEYFTEKYSSNSNSYLLKNNIKIKKKIKI